MTVYEFIYEHFYLCDVEGVFLYCPCGRDHNSLRCDDDEYDSMADDVYAYEHEEDVWDNHYNDSLN